MLETKERPRTEPDAEADAPERAAIPRPGGKPPICTPEEVLKMVSRFARGQRVGKNATIRFRALDLLGRRYGLWGNLPGTRPTPEAGCGSLEDGNLEIIWGGRRATAKRRPKHAAGR